MIINRKTGKTALYYLSTNPGLDKTSIYPRIPNTEMTRAKIENNKIQRTVFYPTIDKALTGMDLEIKGLELYIYSPGNIRIESLLEPSITDSPKSIHTKEYWYLAPVVLRYQGKIKVLGKLKTLPYSYGPRGLTGKLYTWDWEEVLDNSWDKPKLTK